MIKILVVDDEPGMRQVVLNVLKPEGHQMFSAEDGAQALELAKTEHPNLVMLDMRLPDMDGLDILSEIKKMNPETIVIMLSGFGDVESAVGAIKLGAFDYISKPFKVEEVLTQVRKALGTQTLAKEGMLRKTDTPSAGAVSAPAVPKTRKKISIKPFIAAGIIIGILGALAGIFFFFSGAKDSVYKVPYSNPTSITYDGTSIWTTDWVTQSFYQHKTDKMLTMTQTYYLQDSHPTGITFDGEYLWSSNAWESVIYKHQLNKSLKVLETFQSPGPEPTGLYWDGVFLWVCDIGQAKIYKVKITDDGLATIDTYESPGNNPVGIFNDGTYFWVGDSETNRIYQMDEGFSVKAVYIIPQFEKTKGRLSAVSWDGEMIWACSDESNEVCRISFKSLRKLNF